MEGKDIMVKRYYLYLLIILIICFSTTASATSIIFPPFEATSGQAINIPVIIDNIDNMAGIKLSLEYDNKILIYQKGEKTRITSSLMHIINDKKPGKLIIVMAGARGVKVTNQAIINLYFKVNNIEKDTVSTSFVVKEIQLMSDTLKEIDCNIKVNPVVITKNKSKKIEKQNPAKELKKEAAKTDNTNNNENKNDNNKTNNKKIQEKSKDIQSKEKSKDIQSKEKSKDIQSKEKSNDIQLKEKSNDNQLKEKSNDNQLKEKSNDNQLKEKSNDNQLR